MKQYISEKQLNELSKKGKVKLIAWSKGCKSFQDEILEGGYDPNVPLLSIGQMIEFLDEHDSLFEFDYVEDLFLVADYGEDGKEYLKPKDWCDALWEAVKEILSSV